MSHPPSDHRERGSHAVGKPHRKRPIWLWLLLALIALALLLLLLSRCGGDDSSDKSSAAASSATPTTSPTTSPTATPTTSPTATPTATESASASPSASAGSAPSGGNLTAAGTSLLAGTSSAPTGDLQKYAGKPVRATGVTVQSVPADEGFWVGPSATDRVWVQLKGGTESGYTVKQGDKVDFAGTMVRHGSPFAGKAGVTAAEGAQQLTSEKAHVRVRQGSVTLSES